MSSKTPQILDGIFAINKPASVSSAGVLRDLQHHFNPSTFFAPTVAAERDRRLAESHNQQHKRSRRSRGAINVKLGHGGTLDPAATGVLIVGVGAGTKSLNSFLGCTKRYEAVVLFGAATDSYDAEGRVVKRAEHAHVTREGVEGALARFRGSIMQRPPLYSAISVQGKRLYEYAREGKEVPIEIKERPVTVDELELVEWMDGGSHEHRWPDKEAESEEKEVVEKVLHLDHAVRQASPAEGESVLKRKRDEDVDGNGNRNGKVSKSTTLPSRAMASPEPIMSQDEPAPTADLATPPCPAPAARIRMTVSSGFYVRSLCHDLGTAVGSLALMSTLVRSRQGDFELGHNVLEYGDLDGGEEVWAPKLGGMLTQWEDKGRATHEAEAKSGDFLPRDERRVKDEGKARDQIKAVEARPREARAKPAAVKRRNTSSDED